jgi:hypothetical protein
MKPAVEIPKIFIRAKSPGLRPRGFCAPQRSHTRASQFTGSPHSRQTEAMHPLPGQAFTPL